MTTGRPELSRSPHGPDAYASGITSSNPPMAATCASGDVSTSIVVPLFSGAVIELPNSAPPITAIAATVIIVLIRLFMFFDA